MYLFQKFRRLRRVKIFCSALLLFSSDQLITYLNISRLAAILSLAPSTDMKKYFAKSCLGLYLHQNVFDFPLAEYHNVPLIANKQGTTDKLRTPLDQVRCRWSETFILIKKRIWNCRGFFHLEFVFYVLYFINPIISISKYSKISDIEHKTAVRGGGCRPALADHIVSPSGQVN